jgi:hypothetical protein
MCTILESGDGNMPAKKKSTKKSATLSPAMFKVTGAHSSMKINEKSMKRHYFAPKIDAPKASKSIEKDAADLMGTASITIGKPSLKYDFYCTYDAELKLNYLRVRPQEVGVNDQVKGVLVGNEVLSPTKGKDVPGRAVKLNIIELFEITRNDGMTLDGFTGGPAKAIEKLLSGPGKKTATPAWVKKNPTSTGPYASLEKVVKAVAKIAGKKPPDAKRVLLHELNFKQLIGYYVPVWYIKVSAGQQSKTMKVNALDGAVSVQV